jgi:GAF domain-containing protein
MEMLAIFARQAAIAISQAEQHEQLGQALAQGLTELMEAYSAGESIELAKVITTAHQGTPPDMLELAAVFNDISALGTAERKACMEVMEVFRTYRRRRSNYY